MSQVWCAMFSKMKTVCINWRKLACFIRIYHTLWQFSCPSLQWSRAILIKRAVVQTWINLCMCACNVSCTSSSVMACHCHCAPQHCTYGQLASAYFPRVAPSPRKYWTCLFAHFLSPFFSLLDIIFDHQWRAQTFNACGVWVSVSEWVFPILCITLPSVCVCLRFIQPPLPLLACAFFLCCASVNVASDDHQKTSSTGSSSNDTAPTDGASLTTISNELMCQWVCLCVCVQHC